MKRLMIGMALVLLAGCGGDDKKTTNALGTDVPNVQVPANAAVSDYVCDEVDEFSDHNGVARSATFTDKGISSYWKDAGFSFTYDENANGEERTLEKYVNTKLENSQYRHQAEHIYWLLQNQAWSKKVTNIDRVWQKDGTFRRIVSNKVDGADKAYYWSIENIQLSDKVSKSIQRHTNPADRDRGGRRYTKIEVTCTYTDR